jgi:hypothetical protein
MATFPFTGDPLSQVEMIYIGYFGRAGDPKGTNFWVADLLAAGDTLAAQVNASASFSVQPEAMATYPLLANPLLATGPGGTALIQSFLESVYFNLFARAADVSGLNFWTNYILGVITANPTNPIAIANAIGLAVFDVALGAQTADQVTLSGKVTAADFMTQQFAIAGINFGALVVPPVTPADFANNVANLFAHEDVQAVGISGSVTQAEAATAAFVANPPSGEIFTGTVGQDTFAGTGHDIFNFPLSGPFGDQHTLTNFDSATDTGVGTQFGPPFTAPTGAHVPGQDLNVVSTAFFSSVLNASFTGSADVSGLNIRGIQTWNIQNTERGEFHTVDLTGDAAIGNVISGLLYLNYNANSGFDSLFIGDNSEPVQETPGVFNLTNFTPFTIAVGNAVGNGDNGVDVDFAASVFTGTALNPDVIWVFANIVGAFEEDNGSFILPEPILNAFNDFDDYCFNYDGFLDSAFAIAAGASSGPNGPVGFEVWHVKSEGAKAIGSNIGLVDGSGPLVTAALGNIVFPTGLNIIALGGEGSQSATTLFLSDDGSSTVLFGTFISDSLLTDWVNLTAIDLTGTSGEVVLTGLQASISISHSNDFLPHMGFDDGGGLLTFVGTGTAGVTITGGSGNSFYDLSSFTATAAHNSSIDGGHGTNGNSEVAFNNGVFTSGLPVTLTHIQVLDDAGTPIFFSDGDFDLTIQGGIINMANFAGLLPLNVPYTLLGGGTIPAGFQLLQLLGADGCTDSTLINNLVIQNGFFNFAVNMQDMADIGFFNITIFAGSPPPLVSTADHLIIYVSDGASPEEFGAQPPGIYNVPVFAVDNYTTVDIWLPFENINGDPHDVGLGTTKFIDQPVVTAFPATVTFHDNTADTGGSPPGGPDDLFLGETQTYDHLLSSNPFLGTFAVETGLIGHATVIVDSSLPPPLPTTITDLGAGRFEIGATDVFNLLAASTSHLVMDLPATGAFVASGLGTENQLLDHGINVVGSIHGENLLQGSSGPVALDIAATSGVASTFNDAYFGAVSPVDPLNPFHDVLTGGIFDDNYFPEGGADTVNLAHGTGGSPNTVWFGFYDVGYSGTQEFGTAPGHIFEQAITDFTDKTGTSEMFVDGYGTSLLILNNFTFGTGGDTINFGTSDWASTEPPTAGGVQGLVEWDGNTYFARTSAVVPAVYDTVSTAGDVVANGTLVLLDNIGGGYISASALQTALTTPTGHVLLATGPGAGGVAAGTTVDMLLAYQNSTTKEIDIADVTIHAGASNITDTDVLGVGGTLTVTNLISISNPTGLIGLANLSADNIHFFHA